MRFVFIFCCLLFNLALYAQTKHALLIGISNYPNNEQRNQLWDNLNSKNDIQLLSSTIKKHGFENKNVKILSDNECSAQNIISEFNQLSKNIATGDLIHIHFSAHGQQITDLNGDENDKFDESIACFNSPSKFFEGYTGEDHLTDDQLNEAFKALRKKLGPNGHILVTFDTCHSGTLSRGGEHGNRRGNGCPMILPENLKQKDINSDDQSNSGWLTISNNEDSLASMVSFSGCLSDEVNYEIKVNGKNYGGLTYAFCQLLNQPKIQEWNYEECYIYLKNTMLRNLHNTSSVLTQTPCFDGNLKLIFFSGQLSQIESKYEIAIWNKYQATIAAGLIQNLSVGDTIGIYELNNHLLKNKGVIENLTATTAEIKLNNQVNNSKQPSDYYAQLISKSINYTPIKVAIQGNKKQIKLISDSLTSPQILISNDTSTADLIIFTDNSKTVTVSSPSDKTVIRGIKNWDYSRLGEIRKEIVNYKLISDFASIEIHELDNVNIRCKRGQLNNQKKSENDVKIKELVFFHPLEWLNGVIGGMEENNIIEFSITNSNNTPVHFFVLNIESDGKLSKSHDHWHSKAIAPQGIGLSYFKVSKGDVYKILVSRQEFDLSGAPIVLAGAIKRNGKEDTLTQFLFPQKVQSRSAVSSQYIITNFLVNIDAN